VVLDASAIVKSLTEPETDAALTSLLRSAELHSPPLLDHEVASPTHGLMLGILDEEQAVQAIRTVEDLTVEEHNLLGSLTSLIAVRHNFTVDDAAHAVLARALTGTTGDCERGGGRYAQTRGRRRHLCRVRLSAPAATLGSELLQRGVAQHQPLESGATEVDLGLRAVTGSTGGHHGAQPPGVMGNAIASVE
jgi:predicted nucleic acid-binding protein